ncbi:UNVERIFIED_CONTAM: serine/threonine-protein kinase RsbW [Acetivibrio alkalicellulosi]
MKVLKSYYSILSSEKINTRLLVNDILEFLSCYNTKEAIDQDTLFEVKVILNELMQNALNHGNKKDIAKVIKVQVNIIENNMLCIVIEDEGEGYNFRYLMEVIEKPQENLLEICDLKENGRGLMLVKSLSDKILFNDKGNKIEVLKKLR